MKEIPFYKPTIDQREKTLINEVLDLEKANDGDGSAGLPLEARALHLWLEGWRGSPLGNRS